MANENTFAPSSDAPDSYPTFNVSPSNPLPDSGSFIAASYGFIAPSLFSFFSVIIGFHIVAAIIQAFKK